MKTTLFAGCTSVAKKGSYGDNYGDNDGNDVLVPPGADATLTLNYPFDEDLVLKLDDPLGYTKDKLIDVVRQGYDIMYNGSISSPISGLLNVTVESKEFGKAFHCIEDLVIEQILYDDEAKEVQVSIGS